MIDAEFCFGSAWSNDTLLGGARWLELWARRMARKNHNGVVKLENDVVVAGALTLKRLKLDGTLGGVNINATLQDSVFQDGSVTVIDGPKTFKQVSPYPPPSLACDRNAPPHALMPNLHLLGCLQTVSVDNLRVESNVGGSDLSGLLTATLPGGAAHPDGLSFAFPSISINQPLSVAKLRYRGE